MGFTRVLNTCPIAVLTHRLATENAGSYRRTLNTFSTGLYWQETDRKKGGSNITLAFPFSISIAPRFISWNHFHPCFQSRVECGAEVYSSGSLHLIPEVLFSSGYSTSMFMAGMRFQHELNPKSKQESDRLDFITKCHGRSGIVGIQLHKENLSVGLRMISRASNNAGNLGSTGTWSNGSDPGAKHRFKSK